MNVNEDVIGEKGATTRWKRRDETNAGVISSEDTRINRVKSAMARRSEAERMLRAQAAGREAEDSRSTFQAAKGKPVERE